jgi:hypothetical protein
MAFYVNTALRQYVRATTINLLGLWTLALDEAESITVLFP